MLFLPELVSECLLQIIGVYGMGKATHFGVPRGYYLVGSSGYSYIANSGHMMYAGSLLYLLFGGALIIYYLVMIPTAVASSRHAYDKLTESLLVACCLSLFVTYWSSWLFWAGYVKTAGDL
jgi:hypothetical protein